jgi:hypothetical protein
MEIISIRKAGKRVSPSREFTEYIGNETQNGFTSENETRTSLRVGIGMAYGFTSGDSVTYGNSVTYRNNFVIL